LKSENEIHCIFDDFALMQNHQPSVPRFPIPDNYRDIGVSGYVLLINN